MLFSQTSAVSDQLYFQRIKEQQIPINPKRHLFQTRNMKQCGGGEEDYSALPTVLLKCRHEIIDHNCSLIPF